MNVVIEKEPFVHSIVDNFLSEDDFDFLLEYVNSKPNFLNGNNHYTEVYRNETQSELTKRLWKYFDIILDEIFDKVNVVNKQYDKDNTYREIELYNWGDDSYRDIHVAEFEKVISSTFYIYPKEQIGTILYGHILPSMNEDVDDLYQIEWKQNRMMSFVSSGITYHQVSKELGKPRVTINFNIKVNRDE